MILNNLINESTNDEKSAYTKLAKKFISWRGPSSFELDDNGFINNINELATIRLRKTDPDIDEIFDEHGISKLFFGKCEGDFMIVEISQIKSLKNLPTICNGNFYLHKAQNIDIFDLNIEHFVDLTIDACSINDITKIKNVELLIINRCDNINTFDKLPSYVLNKNDTNQIQICDGSFNNASKTSNNAINNLKLFNIENIKNVDNFPTNLSVLDIKACSDFKSFSGIEKLDNLVKFISDITEHNNIINVLMSKSLQYLDIKFLSNTSVFFIIHKYMKKCVSQRSDHVMDCAIELIDAGFEEAAEL